MGAMWCKDNTQAGGGCDNNHTNISWQEENAPINPMVPPLSGTIHHLKLIKLDGFTLVFIVNSK